MGFVAMAAYSPNVKCHSLYGCGINCEARGVAIYGVDWGGQVHPHFSTDGVSNLLKIDACRAGQFMGVINRGSGFR